MKISTKYMIISELLGQSVQSQISDNYRQKLKQQIQNKYLSPKNSFLYFITLGTMKIKYKVVTYTVSLLILFGITGTVLNPVAAKEIVQKIVNCNVNIQCYGVRTDASNPIQYTTIYDSNTNKQIAIDNISFVVSQEEEIKIVEQIGGTRLNNEPGMFVYRLPRGSIIRILDRNSSLIRPKMYSITGIFSNTYLNDVIDYDYELYKMKLGNEVFGRYLVTSGKHLDKNSMEYKKRDELLSQLKKKPIQELSLAEKKLFFENLYEIKNARLMIENWPEDGSYIPQEVSHIYEFEGSTFRYLFKIDPRSHAKQLYRVYSEQTSTLLIEY